MKSATSATLLVAKASKIGPISLQNEQPHLDFERRLRVLNNLVHEVKDSDYVV